MTPRVDHREMPLKDPEARRQYHRGYMRGWYQKNREIHLARVLKNVRERRQRVNDFVDGFKRRPCLDCGGRFPTFLMDFDHVRGAKIANLAKLRGGRAAWRMIVEEIAKCEVVCSNCHRLRTYLRNHGIDVRPNEIMARLGPNYVSVLVY